MRTLRVFLAFALGVGCGADPGAVAGPSFVDITWMSMANTHYQIGDVGVVTDGYFSGLPVDDFYGDGGGLEHTRRPHQPDVDAVARVLVALGGATRINLLLTGHSHFDHSFDTATWSRLTGAPIYGSQTTCYQAVAGNVPADRCTPVFGGEAIAIAPGVTMFVVRWNHSGDSQRNPEQHNPIELEEVPIPRPGGRAACARASQRTFPMAAAAAPTSSGSTAPRGVSAGSIKARPARLISTYRSWSTGLTTVRRSTTWRSRWTRQKLESVDLWIGQGGVRVAKLVLPIVLPNAFLPIHWDGLTPPFEAGMPDRFSDPPLEQLLSGAGSS